MIKLELATDSDHDMNILNPSGDIIGAMVLEESIPSRIHKELKDKPDLKLIEEYNKPYEALWVGTIRIDLTYMSKELLAEVFMKISYYALFKSYTSLQLTATKDSFNSTFKDLGFELKGHLGSLDQYLLEKPLV